MGRSDRAELRVLVPGDPDQKTGGYRYVSRLVQELRQQGVEAQVKGLAGQFPKPDLEAEAAMDSALAQCEDGALVLLDGLAMGAMPNVVERHAGRLRLWSLVHHPLADETGLAAADAAFFFQAETRALAAVAGVIVTSPHTALRLEDFQVSPDRIHVVEPGADTVLIHEQPNRQPSTPAEPLLLCVATLSPRKAQHQLVEALAKLAHLPWRCSLVGSTEREPDYAESVARQIREAGLERRIHLAGELGDESLADFYRSADCFVLPSLYEGYGMVIDEALAAGLAVISSDGGALAKTGDRPGVQLYSAGSVDELVSALETFLKSREDLEALAADARQSARAMRRWGDAAKEAAKALGLGQNGADHSEFDAHWLSLREPADHRARNPAVLSELQAWIQGQLGEEEIRTVDLGAGAGSNGRFLSARLGNPQHWTLLDQDEALLALAQERLTSDQVEVAVRRCRLDQDALEALIPQTTHLITASALIDLVSDSWVQALAVVAAQRGSAVHIALSYAGQFRLSPDHPDDSLIRSLVNAHQHSDKGDGAALGPEATDRLTAALEGQGYTVSTGPSSWQLGTEDQDLQEALMAGWCEAAMEQDPAQMDTVREWQNQRLAQLAQGRLRIEVDHLDLFARP